LRTRLSRMERAVGWFVTLRIAPKVLLPGRGLKERLKHTLRQK
jgi:hypothetical protein